MYYTARKMKFSFIDFFSKCDQINRKLLIWSYLLKKPLMENFIFVQYHGMEQFPFRVISAILIFSFPLPLL